MYGQYEVTYYYFLKSIREWDESYAKLDKAWWLRNLNTLYFERRAFPLAFYFLFGDPFAEPSEFDKGISTYIPYSETDE